MTAKGDPASGAGGNGAKNCFSSMMFTEESLNKEYIAMMSQEYQGSDFVSSSVPVFKQGLRSNAAFRSSRNLNNF